MADRLRRLGRERALIYKALVLTGLRKNDLASILINQAELDGPMQFLILDAGDEKNGQGSDVPIREDLAADLREWIELQRASYCGPDEEFGQKPLFVVPASINRIIDRDMVAAGIPKRDERGRVVDLHALRTKFGTLLSKGGVTPRTAQAAMCHSDISLTMGVYTDPKLLDVHGAMDALPELPLTGTPDCETVTFRLTGTDSEKALPPVLPLATGKGRHFRSSAGTLTDDAGSPQKDVRAVETSLKPTKKGSLTGFVKEPSEIAPLGFEPRLTESESVVLPLH